MLMRKITPLACFAGVVLLLGSACRGNRSPIPAEAVIPAQELQEIKRAAFEYAKEYVLSDAEIDALYKPAKPAPAVKGKKSQEDFNKLYDWAFNEQERRVPAVSQVRGVQLTPLSRNRCALTFNFVPSNNPRTEIPPASAVAERFETETGHYWVVRAARSR